jgi:hypothetical protein
MAMRAQLWNTHQLAVEFGLSYRVAAARLADVEIVEMRGKMAMYKLSDAAPVLVDRDNGAPRPPSPEARAAFDAIGAPFTVGEHPVNEAIAIICSIFAERVPGQAATLAVFSGAPLAVASLLHKSMIVQMAELIDELTSQFGIEWRREDHHTIGPEPNWKLLAKHVGEPVNRRAWRKHEVAMPKRFGQLTAE